MKVYIPFFVYKDRVGGVFIGNPSSSISMVQKELELIVEARSENAMFDPGGYAAGIVEREVCI